MYGIPTKNEKCTPFLHCILSFEDTTTRSFASCCFILAFTSADIIFHRFLELHSILPEKKDFRHEFSFFNGFTQTSHLIPLLPLN